MYAIQLQYISVREGVFSVSVFDDFIVKQLIECIVSFYTNCVLLLRLIVFLSVLSVRFYNKYKIGAE